MLHARTEREGVLISSQLLQIPTESCNIPGPGGLVDGFE